MKRQLILMTAAALLFLSAACSQKKTASSVRSDILSGGTVSSSGKTEITVGMPAVNKLVEPAIISFNNSQKDYYIKIIDYSKFVEDDDVNCSKAKKQLQLDLIKGEAPDIIVMNPSDMQALVRKGVFADMYGLMDDYGGVSREEFIPTALGSFEVNGQIPAITPNFDLYTAVAKTKFVGEDKENWTIDDVVMAYEQLPDDMKLLHSQLCDPQEVCSYVTYKLSGKCVDFENNTCDFRTPVFAEALDFAGRFGSENAELKYSTDLTSYVGEEFQNEMINDRALISQIIITSFNQSVAWSVCYDFGGEAVTFVGYPSEDGRGSVADCRWLYGISSDTPNKEAAWKFIVYMLKDKKFQNRMNDEGRGLPLIKSFYDDYLDIPAEDDDSIFFVPEWQADEPISRAQAEEIRDYIFRTEIDPYFNFDINNMINEECAAVLNGEKSGSECAELLDSRVGIYLSERE